MSDHKLEVQHGPRRDSDTSSVKSRLITGILWALPIIVVVLLVMKVWGWGLGIALYIRAWIPPPTLEPMYEHLLLAVLTVLSLVLVVLVVWAIGTLLQRGLSSQILNGLRDLLARFPVLGQVYRISKSVIENVQDCFKQQGLGRPVLIAFPHQGIKTLGFLTADRESTWWSWLLLRPHRLEVLCVWSSVSR